MFDLGSASHSMNPFFFRFTLLRKFLHNLQCNFYTIYILIKQFTIQRLILLFTLVRISSFWEVKFVSVVQSSIVYRINIQFRPKDIDRDKLMVAS